MRCVNSLWTGAAVFRLDFKRLLVHTLALCAARRSMGNVHFVTDHLGVTIAGLLGWELDSVSIGLEAMPPSFRHIWAAGKLYANAIQNERFLQFDTDVILLNKIDPGGTIFVQSIDNPDFYRNPRIKALLTIAGQEPEAPAYNVGIVGGEPRILSRFAVSALDLCASHFLDFRNDGTNCSMIAEQVYIHRFCSLRLIEVTTLFREYPTEAEAAKLGYVHLQGTSKIDDRRVKDVSRRLKGDFPAQYKKFMEGIGELELQVPGSYHSPE